MGEIVDLYAGPGGWSEALRLLGRSPDEIGIEYEPNACATRAAAGHRTLQADVSTIDEQDYADLEGLIASPPCQAFSSAGKGAARDLIPRAPRLDPQPPLGRPCRSRPSRVADRGPRPLPRTS